jgi:hypothetical protein
MPVSGKVLEDSIRLSQIRRIKLALYVVQTGALIGLAFFVVFVMGGARFTPRLYLPIPSFIAVFILLLLIICIESFFFRILEIRFARSSSARHLMAKNSMKRSLLIALITGIAAIILAVPSVLGVIEDASSNEVAVSAVEEAPSFYSSDALDLISVTRVKVTALQVVEVYLVTEEVFDANKGDLAELYSLRVNRPMSQYKVVDEELTIRVPTGEYVKYYLVLNDMDNPGTSATFTMLRSVSNTFTGVILMFMIAFVVSNIAWFAYLIPIERKYSVGSIYK